MSSDIEICNHALAIMGEEPVITLDDTSKAARACKAFYPVIRDELLRYHPWPFALRRVTLAERARATSDELGPYEKAFAIPDNCMRIIDVYTDNYTIEGQNILANESPLQCRYIRNDLVPDEFDSVFRHLLATKLAYTLIPRITNDKELMKYLDSKILTLTSEARHISSAELNAPEEFNATSWILSRQ